jgi:hypothetical protein
MLRPIQVFSPRDARQFFDAFSQSLKPPKKALVLFPTRDFFGRASMASPSRLSIPALSRSPRERGLYRYPFRENRGIYGCGLENDQVAPRNRKATAIRIASGRPVPRLLTPASRIQLSQRRFCRLVPGSYCHFVPLTCLSRVLGNTIPTSVQTT